MIELNRAEKREKEEKRWRIYLGNVMRSVRNEHGKSVEEVAERMGTSINHLSAIEKGILDMRSYDMIYFCEACGVNTGDFIEKLDEGWRNYEKNSI